MLQNFLREKWSGFTLVELLVIIAIIGLISSILAAGIKGQLDRARDARAKSNMNQLRIEAVEIRQDYGSYDPSILCCDGPSCKPEVVKNCDEVESLVKIEPVINSTTNEFCIYVKLSSGLYFCLDSAGVAGEFDSVDNCTSTSYSCK